MPGLAAVEMVAAPGIRSSWWLPWASPCLEIGLSTDNAAKIRGEFEAWAKSARRIGAATPASGEDVAGRTGRSQHGA